MDSEEYQLKIKTLANSVAEENQADVFLFNAPISWEFKKGSFADVCHLTKRRKNILLILITNGGNPDAAYRMARCLQRTYSNGRVIVLIPSLCKSAGTLVAIGAHEIALADRGELGPLDVQLRKPDDLLERMSGLDVNEALTSMQTKAFEAFERYLLDLNFRSGGSISLKTAMQIATELTVGLFEPIYGQIDPLRMGEIAREIKIADEYGRRLNKIAKNLKDGALERLVASYPSHTFVIDQNEAKDLFQHVRELTPSENALLNHLGDCVQKPLDTPISLFLSTDVEEENDTTNSTIADGTIAQVDTPTPTADREMPTSCE
jgi:hypothetical protein